MSKYMWALVLSGAVPFVLSFYRPLGFYRHGRALAAAIGLEALIFSLWDIFATWRGHWSFDPASVGTLKIVNLPLEEFLFFLVIPFCCIFTWEALRFLKARRR